MLKIWLMALACSGGQGIDEDDEDTIDDTGEVSQPPRYPDGDRALIYYGHGGTAGTTGGMGQFDDVDVRWKDQFSWNTDWKETLPEDLSPYRLIVMAAPGYSDSVAVDDKTVSALDSALERGTRLAILADTTTCSEPTVNTLLEDLGVSIRFTGDGLDANRLEDLDSFSTQSQITTGLTSLRLKDHCFIDVGEGEGLIKDDERNVVAAAERPRNAGDIVLIGDYEFMDDGGLLEYADNALLADNLVLVEP